MRTQRTRICKRCGKRDWTASEIDLCRDCYYYECCGKKVKPKIIIPYRCESCQEKSKLNKKEVKNVLEKKEEATI